ncbi:MAG: hypothetical protein ABFS86_02680, partial [Planctomycetota bacterium]
MIDLDRLAADLLEQLPGRFGLADDLRADYVPNPGNDWHLLDWDDVRIGDPAGEYASLLRFPTGRGLDPLPLLPADPEFRERFDLLLRAYCFDEIVDPLSDLTEMPEGLADGDRLRRERHERS